MCPDFIVTILNINSNKIPQKNWFLLFNYCTKNTSIATTRKKRRNCEEYLKIPQAESAILQFLKEFFVMNHLPKATNTF